MKRAIQIIGVCCAAILALAIGGLIDGIDQAEEHIPVRIVADRTRHASAVLPPRAVHASVQPQGTEP